MAEKSKMAAGVFDDIDNISIIVCISIYVKESKILLGSRQTLIKNLKMIERIFTELSPFPLLKYPTK